MSTTAQKNEMLKIAKPILFNTEMVKAILSGSKTETRRPLKPQPLFYTGRRYIFADETCPKKWEDCDNIISTYQYQPGDILYVRETWCNINKPGTTPDYYYLADYLSPVIEDYDPNEWKWRPSIHMPKEAARIFLRVTDVKVERVQDITEEGAIAEGIPQEILKEFGRPCGWFKSFWDSVYKSRGYSWDKSPWVWVIKFERLEV